MASTIAAVALLAALAQAQGNYSTPTITAGGSYSTATFNYSAASTYLPLTDFSNEQLQFLWDQVGPLETATITTTVEPTPEPSEFPKPNYIHPLVPSYISELGNATLPDNFLWGVASAAFQIEGAVDAEGKGPSVSRSFIFRAEDVDQRRFILQPHRRFSAQEAGCQYFEDLLLTSATGLGSTSPSLG